MPYELVLSPDNQFVSKFFDNDFVFDNVTTEQASDNRSQVSFQTNHSYHSEESPFSKVPRLVELILAQSEVFQLQVSPDPAQAMSISL